MLSTALAALGNDRFLVGGYAPDYRLNALDIQSLAPNLTTLILFSIEPELHGGGSLDTHRLSTMHLLRAARAKLSKAAKTSSTANSTASSFKQAASKSAPTKAAAAPASKACTT